MKEESQKNPLVAVRTMPNNISLSMIAEYLGLRVLRKDLLELEGLDIEIDMDDDLFYLVVLEKDL